MVVPRLWRVRLEVLRRNRVRVASAVEGEHVRRDVLIFGVPWKVILLELLWSVAFGGFIGCCYHLILRTKKFRR